MISNNSANAREKKDTELTGSLEIVIILHALMLAIVFYVVKCRCF